MRALGLAAAAAGAVGVGLLVAFAGRRSNASGGLADIEGGKESLQNMPEKWWHKPAPREDRRCYRSKTDALNKFREWNQGVIDDYGGMSARGSRGEFDALTKYDALATNIAEALWLALPPERVNFGKGPFCLDQIDVEALNDTSPARDHPVGFKMPDFVFESEIRRKEAEYHRTQRRQQRESKKRSAVPF
jgi:hypothetical protein